MAGCYQFLAPYDTMYYFSFSAPAWRPTNQNLTEWAKITAYKKDQVTGPPPYVARVFYKYLAATTTNSTIDHIKGHFTCQFITYMKTGDLLWLQNDVADTIIAGATQYQVEFSAWMFKPTDDNQENQACFNSGQ